MRKDILVNDQYYHIFNRSIAKFQIFNNNNDFVRFIGLLELYQYKDIIYKYSKMKDLDPKHQKAIMLDLSKNNDRIVEIVAYCLMPTHFHLILKQISKDGITEFMRKIQDSYTRYFNILHGRKGPLWEGHFNNVTVTTDEQMLHLSRYIHLNPVTAGLVKKPNQWKYSSYSEYINKTEDGLCRFKDIIDIPVDKYKEFVLDQITYQKEIAIIKKLLFDNYSG